MQRNVYKTIQAQNRPIITYLQHPGPIGLSEKSLPCTSHAMTLTWATSTPVFSFISSDMQILECYHAKLKGRYRLRSR